MSLIKEIKSKFDELKAKDKNLSLFGARDHNYEFGPKLNIDNIKEVESSNGIQLPTDYKEFLIELGDGGVGKSYGFYNLQKAVSHGELEGDFKGVDFLKKQEAEKCWEHDKMILIEKYGTALTDKFKQDLVNIHAIELFEEAEKMNLSLNDKFKLNFWIYDAIDSLDAIPPDYYDVYMEIDLGLIKGYISLFAHGCGHIAGLIVKGDDYGKIVEIGNDGQLEKTDKSFQEYYLNWLNHSIEEIDNKQSQLEI